MQNTKVSFSEEIAKKANDLCHKACLLKYPVDISHLGCIYGILNCQLILENAYSERAEKSLENSVSRLAAFNIYDDKSAQKYIDDIEPKIAFWEVCKKNFDTETESRLQKLNQKFLDIVWED